MKYEVEIRVPTGECTGLGHVIKTVVVEGESRNDVHKRLKEQLDPTQVILSVRPVG